MQRSKTLWVFSAAMTILTASAAKATMVDLTTAGASGSINGAIFLQDATQPAGVGVFQPFLRLQANGTEEGLNTDHQPFPFDDKNPSNWTHSVLASDVATISYNGGLYKQLGLDINQSNTAANSQLTLSELKLYISDKPDEYTLASLGTPVYDLNAGAGGNSVLLDGNLNPGLGKSDMIALIPSSAFDGHAGQYLYLYSKFTNSNSGFEQWNFGQAMTPAVPEPSSAVITVLGLGCLAGVRLRGWRKAARRSPATETEPRPLG